MTKIKYLMLGIIVFCLFVAVDVKSISRPVIVGNSVYRTASTANIRFLSNTDGTAYYKITSTNIVPSDIVTGGNSTSVTANTTINVNLTELSSGAQYVHIVLDTENGLSNVLTIVMPYDIYYFENFEAYPESTKVYSLSPQLYIWTGAHGTGRENQEIILDGDDKVLKTSANIKGVDIRTDFTTSITDGYIVYRANVKNSETHSYLQYGALTLGNDNTEARRILVGIKSSNNVFGYDNFSWNNGNKSATNNTEYKQEIALDVDSKKYDYYVDNVKINTTNQITANYSGEPLWFGIYNGGGDSYYDNIELYVTDAYFHGIIKHSEINGTFEINKTTASDGEIVEILNIVPDTNYRLKEIKILKSSDNSDITSSVNYNRTNKTFTMPGYEVKVKLEFEFIPYNITFNTVNGVIYDETSPIMVNSGTNKDIEITADTGYRLKSVKVNGAEKLPLINNKLTLTNITEDKNIVVTVEKIPYTITVNSATGATITPNGTTNVEYGDSQEITITADPGYRLKSVKVNGAEKLPLINNKLTLTNITEDKNIVVTVEKIPYTIIVNSATGATITPNGTTNVEYGDSQEITITADLGYRLKSVKVNGAEKLPLTDNKLTLTNIEENKNVVVTAEKIEYEVINGNNQKYTIGKETDAVFRINADKSLFNKVYLNNKEVDAKFYTVTEGSTIITLKQDFLNRLLPGTYDLKATFNDGGEAITTFVIIKSVEENPKTGDSIMLLIIIGSISLIASAFSINGLNNYKTKKY